MTQRRTVLTGLAALPLIALVRPAAAQAAGTPLPPDMLDTGESSLAIQPVNHASLILSAGNNVFYFDPVGGAERFAGFAPPTAIFVTHAHGDHLDVPTLQAIAGSGQTIIAPQVVIDKLPNDLKARTKLMANRDTETIDSIPVSAVPAYNTTQDRLKYHPKGVGNGYVLTYGDRKIYVAGDTEGVSEMEALSGIDVAFVPMNLPFTMTGEAAAVAVKAFKPRIVYPYHYGKDGPEPAKFAAAMGETDGIEVRQRDWYQYG